jgi:hypothetical protein
MGGVVSGLSDALTGASKAIGVKDVVDNAWKGASNIITNVSDAVGLKQPLDDAKNAVEGAVHWVGETTGLDKIGDAIGDSPVAKTVIAAVAAYFGAPYLAKWAGLGSTQAATMASQQAAWEASSLASMGASTAEIAANLSAYGMPQATAMQVATMAATGASESMIASTLTGGANQAAAVAYAKDAAGMGFTEAQIGKDLVSMGMSNQGAGMLAADAMSGTSMQALLASYAPSVASGGASVLSSVANGISKVGSSLTNPVGGASTLDTFLGALGGVANTAGNLYVQQQALDFSKQQAETARQTGLLGQQQLNQLSQQAQNQAQFKPYGITSNLGSANVDASGNTSLGMSQQTQQLQNQLTNNALGVTAQNPMVSQQGLFTAMQDVNSAENQRNRLVLENRLAAQGRLGTGTSMFGGASPEMYAIEAAQQQQTANNYLASMQQAGSLTGQNLTNQQSATANMFAPQQGLLNLASTNATTGGQFNTATQNQAKIAAELGLSGVNTMMQGVTNANDINAAGQANQLGMLNSLIGSTPQYNQQGQVTGYNNNAANTIGGLFNLGSSVYNGVKSIF